MHSVLIILDPSPGRIDPRSTGLGISGKPAAAESRAGDSRRRPARPTAPVRSIRDQRTRLDRHTPSSRAFRSQSDGRDPRIPVRCGVFAKVTLIFPIINPQSTSIQKKLQFSPEISAQPPELFKI